MLMGPNGEAALLREREMITLLNEERDRLLSENGFSNDIIDTVYTCRLCKDTGMLDNGERCACFNDKVEQLLSNQAK